MSGLEKYYQVLTALLFAQVVLYFYYKYVNKDKQFGKNLLAFGLGLLVSLLLALALFWKKSFSCRCFVWTLIDRRTLSGNRSRVYNDTALYKKFSC